MHKAVGPIDGSRVNIRGLRRAFIVFGLAVRYRGICNTSNSCCKHNTAENTFRVEQRGPARGKSNAAEHNNILNRRDLHVMFHCFMPTTNGGGGTAGKGTGSKVNHDSTRVVGVTHPNPTQAQLTDEHSAVGRKRGRHHIGPWKRALSSVGWARFRDGLVPPSWDSRMLGEVELS